ncbi:hypothetical protein P4S64_15000 [Vibrio sp. M60_M31a]
MKTKLTTPTKAIIWSILSKLMDNAISIPTLTQATVTTRIHRAAIISFSNTSTTQQQKIQRCRLQGNRQRYYSREQHNITANVNVGGAAAKEWKHNVAVSRTYATVHTNNCWAYFAGIGWRKIDGISNDGVSNVFNLLVNARAFDRPVSVQIDGSKIYAAYMN